MRRVCYSVATTLDGFIAGPMREYDWIVMDPLPANVKLKLDEFRRRVKDYASVV